METCSGVIVTLPLKGDDSESDKQTLRFLAGTFSGAGQSCPTIVDGIACPGGLLYNCFNKDGANTITESWTCLNCRKTFTRSFKWAEVKTAPVCILHKNADPSEWCPSVQDLEEFSKQLDDMEKDNG
jgi:hypothetical protein